MPPTKPYLRRGVPTSPEHPIETEPRHRYVRRRGPTEVVVERQRRLRAERQTVEREAIVRAVADRAAQLAGGSPPRRHHARWTEEACLAALRGFRATNGRSPRIADLDRDRRLPSRSTVVRLFGSFNAGLVAAGRPLNRIAAHKHRWSDEQILDAIRQAELNGEPTAEPFRTGRRKPWLGTIERHFGTWHVAKSLAGVEPGSGQREVQL